MNEQYYHNPFSTLYRSPFGALPLGGEVRLSIIAPETSAVRLRVWENDSERIIRGRRTGRLVEFYYQPVSTGLKWYYFILDTPDGTQYYGNGDSGNAEDYSGRVYGYEPPAYQLTVYHADFTTPKWFTGGIMYQIFPDRFARGSSRGGLDRLKTHTDFGREVYAQENWYAQPLTAPINGAKDYSPCDFFGGDIEGVRQKLPYLKELGVTCIYFNPIFASPSNHRYDTSDYMHIDGLLGTDEELESFVREAKALGIEIMLDGVFSHTGDDSVYFDKYSRYGGQGAYASRTSPYLSWYDFAAWPDAYRAWWGFKSLPEVNEMNPTYMEFIASVIKRWADAGINSWRLDVADELPDEFIAFLRREVKKNSGVLLGEVWEDASNKLSYGKRREYADGMGLDCVMNYPFRTALFDFLMLRCDAGSLANRLFQLLSNLPEPLCRANMNLLGSHDTVRTLTALAGAPDPSAMTRREQAELTLEPPARERGLKRLVLAAAVQFTMLGVPCIYYGDEAGLEGMADPLCRGTYPWERENIKLLRQYKKLAKLRSESDVLKYGSAAFTACSRDVFIILREYKGERIITAINRSDDARRVSIHSELFPCRAFTQDDLPLGANAKLKPFDGDYYELLSSAELKAEEGKLNIVLAPLSGAVLIEEAKHV